MRRVPSPFPIIALLLVCAGAGGAERTPLVENPNDVIHLRNGGSITGLTQGPPVDGRIMIIEIGQTRPVAVQASDILRTEYRMTAAQVVSRRGQQALAENDLLDVVRTMKWGIEKNVNDRVLDLGRKALAKQPGNTDVAAIQLDLLSAANDVDGIIALCQAVLKVDRRWDRGHEALVKAHGDRQDVAGLDAAVKSWLESSPTALGPNKLAAAVYERAGVWRSAQECWRKGYELHKDWECAAGYARTSLRRGDRAKAIAAAEALIAAGQYVDQALAVKGSAHLADGDPAKAQPALEQAVASTALPADLAEIVRYNLGLCHYRAGRLAEAKPLWTQVKHPVGALAMAIAERKPFTPIDSLPADIAPLAVELNVCVDLENMRWDLKGIDGKGNRRHLFLQQIAELGRNVKADDVLRQIAGTDTRESQRWQAYAHLAAKRWDQAEAILARLPADDGYAAVYRVYAAEGRGQKGVARELFRKAQGATRPAAPADYIAKLRMSYANENNELIEDRFEMAESDLATNGWSISASGTGILVRPVSGRLVFEGTQAASADPINRAWRHIPGDRFRMAQISVDLSGLNAASGGLEVLDGARKNGVQLSVQGDNTLAWREVKDGAASGWNNLPIQVAGTQTVLKIDLQAGQLSALSPSSDTQRHSLGDSLARATGELCVGVFAFADPGVKFVFAVDDLKIQLKPLSGRK